MIFKLRCPPDLCYIVKSSTGTFMETDWGHAGATTASLMPNYTYTNNALEEVACRIGCANTDG